MALELWPGKLRLFVQQARPPHHAGAFANFLRQLLHVSADVLRIQPVPEYGSVLDLSRRMWVHANT